MEISLLLLKDTLCMYTYIHMYNVKFIYTCNLSKYYEVLNFEVNITKTITE